MLSKTRNLEIELFPSRCENNRQPCGANFDNSQQCNLAAQYTLSTPGVNIWHIYNITTIVKNEYSDNNNNISIALRDPPDNDFKQVYYHSKEHSNITTRPYLNITYSAGEYTSEEWDLTYDDKGNLEVYSNYQKTPNDELIMNFKGNDVLIIDNQNGSMYLKGNILENQNAFNIKDNSDEWIIKDTNGNVVLYVNESGYIFMKGTVNTSRITGYKNSFTIKDNFGNKAARFDDTGNVVLKGTLEQNSSYQRTANDEWIIRNNENDVFILDTINGSLYIDGTLFENQTTLNPKEGSDDFIVKNEFGNAVGYVNESGSMFLRGGLKENV